MRRPGAGVGLEGVFGVSMGPDAVTKKVIIVQEGRV